MHSQHGIHELQTPYIAISVRMLALHRLVRCSDSMQSALRCEMGIVSPCLPARVKAQRYNAERLHNLVVRLASPIFARYKGIRILRFAAMSHAGSDLRRELCLRVALRIIIRAIQGSAKGIPVRWALICRCLA